MQISIITVTYNSAATVRETLKSIESQTYPDIEHIIIDGASKDNTLKIVHEFKHVAKVISEPDKGIYDAMNKGIKMATGEVIGILNSDDFYANNEVIAKVVNLFKKDATLEAVYADLVFVDKDNISAVKRKWIASNFAIEKFLYGWMPPHPTFFVRKDVYERYGFFNTGFKSSADYELMLRFLYKHNIRAAYLPEVIIKMRLGGQSTVSIKNRIKANKEDRFAWKINNLEPEFYTLWLKPLLKIPQFFKR